MFFYRLTLLLTFAFICPFSCVELVNNTLHQPLLHYHVEHKLTEKYVTHMPFMTVLIKVLVIEINGFSSDHYAIFHFVLP